MLKGYVTHSVVKPNSALYAIKKKKKKIPKLINITVSSDNEIGTKGLLRKTKDNRLAFCRAFGRSPKQWSCAYDHPRAYMSIRVIKCPCTRTCDPPNFILSGEIKKVKLSHAFNYIIPQKLGYRSTIDELVEKEKNENTLRYIDEIKASFIWAYKKKLNDFIIPFQFGKDEKFCVTQDNIVDYLLCRGLIRENDDVYDKMKSKKIKLSDFGTYPIKYTFLNNININVTVKIFKNK
ncbi:hypothetical protein POVCU2_0019270 [Plasmodium ovale curtisi]|uniref:Ribosomal protein L9 domain-containing protein n=1 Tax=Plasmodium ovale curtisi TaxID=864141 RepID=A0A1A8WA73_PLAOA|nr:hypothetical protein POVCU2_0019270 [Plasmodium ovale curtisi]SBS89749.1 hypothetical protein POVCU1_016980 [Plasmodium ovale curtisi]